MTNTQNKYRKHNLKAMHLKDSYLLLICGLNLFQLLLLTYFLDYIISVFAKTKCRDNIGAAENKGCTCKKVEEKATKKVAAAHRKEPAAIILVRL